MEKALKSFSVKIQFSRLISLRRVVFQISPQSLESDRPGVRHRRLRHPDLPMKAIDLGALARKTIDPVQSFYHAAGIVQ